MSPSAVYALYFLFAVGGFALYFLLPSSRHNRVLPGLVLGVGAIVGLMVLFALAGTSDQNTLFYVLGTIALLAAVRVITHSKPVYSAIYFVLVVVATAGILILQSAEFLAIALLIIYAGAILVTYLFVIMLAQQPTATLYDQNAREPLIGVLVGFVLVGLIAGRVAQYTSPEASATRVATVQNEIPKSAAPDTGNSISLGAVLMTRYVVVLELSGLLLLVSMVGAIALSRKRIESQVQWPHQPLGQIGREVEPF
jgi:NADH-quinone oxidoreductase subunit J